MDDLTINDLKPETLIQYKGGGMEGCFWEWNFAFIDKAGVFHDIGSSGRYGAKTIEKLLERMNDDTHYVFEITTKKGQKAFVTDAVASYIMGVARQLWSRFEIDIEFECAWCGKTKSVLEAEMINEQGQGGLAVAYMDLICDDCNYANRCSWCGELHEPGELDVDQDGRCQYCRKEPEEPQEPTFKQCSCDDIDRRFGG